MASVATRPSPIIPVLSPNRPRVGNDRRDLARLPLVRSVLRHRAFPFVLILANTFFFTLVILSGLVGTSVGNRNFSIIFVWIIWWALLIMVLIPFSARTGEGREQLWRLIEGWLRLPAEPGRSAMGKA